MSATDHPSFKAPSNLDVRIWRYMDLSKFISILQRKAIYFHRASSFDDKFEGLWTRTQAIDPTYKFQEPLILPHGSIVPSGMILTSYDDDNSIFFHSELDQLKYLRTTYFVSSWHVNEKESSAMWKLYTSLSDAICISTTYKSLYEALPLDFLMGTVDYIDYDTSTIEKMNVLNYIITKRESFSHEREARAVLWRLLKSTKDRYPLDTQNGFFLPIDLSAVIKEVYISPQANALTVDVVTRLLEDYKVFAPVIQSGVNAGPDYMS